jgi:hypothetical protein
MSESGDPIDAQLRWNFGENFGDSLRNRPTSLTYNPASQERLAERAFKQLVEWKMSNPVPGLDANSP